MNALKEDKCIEVLKEPCRDLRWRLSVANDNKEREGAFFDRIDKKTDRKRHWQAVLGLSLTVIATALAGCRANDSKLVETGFIESKTVYQAAQKQGAFSQTKGNGAISTNKPTESQEPLDFIEGDFYGKPIKDEDEALKAVYSVIDRLGGDEGTVLDLMDIRPTEDGVSYYTFHQLEGDVAVYGATVKLITDKDGNALALTSSLVPGIDAENMSDWAVTEKEAEEIVKQEIRFTGMKVIEGASEQTLLSFEDAEEEYYYAWVVYTNNIYEDYDTAYLAHYVDAEGDYLYALPVSEPGNADALSGEGAMLAFMGLKEGSYSGTVTLHDGSKKELTVPTLVDPDTGTEYLGDLNRRILCADYADFDFEDTITLREKGKKGFDDCELIIYDTFIRVYDAYADTGWVGPDGDETPTLLLMDWVDEYGDVVNNACYAGRRHGYQVFQFNREDADGECTDIVAHEYTHCMTSTLMLYNLYYNDYGAINEAFSDICGNIIEEMLGDTEDTSWLVGEHNVEPYRSMSDPHLYQQPEYVWDIYYVPHPETVSVINDDGGAHINSSLLNMIGWRLNESGADLSDQLYYWMNVALAMTPRMDYPGLAKILPWCSLISGSPEYAEVLKKAILETGIEDLSGDVKLPEGAGMAEFEVPFADPDSFHYLMVYFTNLETGEIFETWPDDESWRAAATLPEGVYSVMIAFFDEEADCFGQAVFIEDGFYSVDDFELAELYDNPESLAWCEVTDGEIVTLPSESLVPFMELSEEIWSDGEETVYGERAAFQ